MLRPALVCAILLATAGSVQAVEHAAFLHAVASIKASELQSHVDVLADDAFEGREAGSRGGQAAGMYLLDELKKRGLRGAGDAGGYFQAFGQRYRNVLALLEGSDPELKQQVIVISGHYDHVGYGNRRNSYGPFGYVHNGADDNASGIAGLLETVDAFQALPASPRRSVLFAFWDGEEKGLLGSKHWVAHPTVPWQNIAFMLNVDMIGRLRDNKLEVYGSRTAAGLRRLVSELNQDESLRLFFNWEIKENSDHYSFISRGVPTLMFHTGLHEDYHRPSDDTHKLNQAGMEQAARLLFGVAFELSDRDVLAGFRNNAPNETPTHQRELERVMPPLAPRLGVRWHSNSEGDGLVLAHVEPRSACARAGLQPGDRLLEFAGAKITDKDAFRSAVLHAVSPVEVAVQHVGQEQPTTISLELDGTPTRLGLTWREDAAEPGTVLVTRVALGSPAQRAGLQPTDRIYEVNSARFTDARDFYQHVSELPSPITLTVEREGRLQTFALDVPPPRG